MKEKVQALLNLYNDYCLGDDVIEYMERATNEFFISIVDDRTFCFDDGNANYILFYQTPRGYLKI